MATQEKDRLVKLIKDVNDKVEFGTKRTDNID
jgi:hypothetical protein